MQLRPYQHRIRDQVRAAFARTRRVLLAAPCGAGKTTIAADMFERMRCPRGLFIVDRDELVRQGSARFAAVPHGIIKAGYTEDRSRRLQVASIQTLARRELPPADFIIIDEAHVSAAPSYARILANYPRAWVLGITATPARASGAPLSSIYHELVVGATERELIDIGHLVDPVVYAPQQPSTDGLRTRDGDWISEEIEGRVLVGDAVEHWSALGRGRRTAVFTASRRHSAAVVTEFARAGARVAVVDGETPLGERHKTLAALAAHDIDCVVNVDVLTKGWDLPELSCLVVLRMTKSLVVHRQMCGRVMRAGKPDAVVLDHAGNTTRLGFMSESPEWSLDRAVREAPASLRTCRRCFRVMPAGARSCPECGAEPPQEPREPPRVAAGKLAKLSPEDKRTEYAKMVARASALGFRLGSARGWYKDRFGVWPRLMRDIEAEHYACPEHEPEEKTYGYRTVVRCARCLMEMSNA